MTVQPHVSLLFDPHDLAQQAQREVREAVQDKTLRGALERAVFAQHVFMITEARRRLADEKELAPGVVIRVLDYAWEAYNPRFIKVSGPQIALAYGQALKRAKAGDVDPKYINRLAEAHALRLSKYFHETSRDAVVEGFSTYVNRKVPTRAALDKALSAYGLSSRQMRGYTSNAAIDAKISSNVFRRAEAKALDYIAKSLRARIDNFVTQEVHNLDQQAEQIAWLWMVEHKQIPENAEKIWITAKDEKTCVMCAPMHGKVVKIGEQFELPNNIRLWVPGVHPNCRCKARFRVPRRLEIAKADRPYYGDDPEERDRIGRFAARNRPGPRFAEPDVELDEARRRVEEILAAEPEPEPEVERVQMHREPEEVERVRIHGDVERVRMHRPAEVVRMHDVEDVTMHGEPATERVTRPQRVERIQMHRMDPVERVRMHQNVERVIRDLGERIQRAPITPKIKYYNTSYIDTDAHRPVYRVINTREELDSNGRIRFGHDQHWTFNAAEAANHAMNWRQHAIDEAIEAILQEPVADWHPTGAHAGFPMEIELAPEEVEALVNWVASRNTSEAASTQDAEMTVEIMRKDRDHLEVEDMFMQTETVKMSELAELFSIEPDEFRMAVAATVEGHESELGRIDYRPGKQGVVTLSGDFEVQTTHEGSTIVEGIPDMTFYHLAPADTDVEEFGGVPDAE